jgi:hypothetical protein
VQQVLGAEAPMTAFVANDIARFALELGDEPTALRHAQMTLAVAVRDAADDSQTVAMARMQVGRALLAMHRSEEAATLLARAAQAIAAARGADSPLAIDAATLHAAALAQAGRREEAWRLLEPRLVGYRQASTLVRYRGLHTAGVVRRLQGDMAAAAALQEEALAALPEQPLQLSRRNIVLGERAQVALEQGDAASALKWLERIVPPPGAAAQSLEQAARQLTRGRALLATGEPGAAFDVLSQAEATWSALAPKAAAAQEVTRWRERAQSAKAAAAASPAPRRPA